MYDEMDEMSNLVFELDTVGKEGVNYTAETRRGYPNYMMRQEAAAGGAQPAAGAAGAGIAPKVEVEPPCKADFPTWGNAWDQKWLEMANKVGADSYNVWDDCPKYDDPVEACFRECNMKVKQHNINCRLAMKLYSEYLKSIGCKGAACSFTPTDGCKNLGNTCPPPLPGVKSTRRGGGGRFRRKRTVRRR